MKLEGRRYQLTSVEPIKKVARLLNQKELDQTIYEICKGLEGRRYQLTSVEQLNKEN